MSMLTKVNGLKSEKLKHVLGIIVMYLYGNISFSDLKYIFK